MKDVYDVLTNKMIKQYQMSAVLVRDVKYENSVYAQGTRVTILRKYNGIEVLSAKCPICKVQHFFKVDTDDIKIYNFENYLNMTK